MELPVKFPSEADVIAEEAARFRALSAPARMRLLRGLLRAGALTLSQSPKAEFLRAYAEEQEDCARRAVAEFLARHGG